jgi:tRNA (guanine-N7-)-methyltransferase
MGSDMARTPKTPKFDAFNSSAHCFGSRQEHDGTWQDHFAYSGQKLTVEVGCGHAELSLELARRYPDELFIGVDKKSDRMSRAAILASQEKLQNIGFIQTDSRQLQEFFDESQVDVVWVTFPDPYPRVKHEKNRLMNQRFIGIYKNLLKPGGLIRFKTDDETLFDYFMQEIFPKHKDLEILLESRDLHDSDLPEEYKIITTYEERWIAEGRKIFFVELRFNQIDASPGIK